MAALYQFSSNLLYKSFGKWRQGDEEEGWKSKAVEAVMKKLRKIPNAVENLNLALERKSPDTPCTTLNRSQDGRFQVAHRKMLPHVMYCRVWRWPDLQSQHELKSVPNCQFPPQRAQSKSVCINPYHYVRVEHTIYPPVVTPQNEFQNLQSTRANSPSSNPSQSSPNPYNQVYDSSQQLALSTSQLSNTGATSIYYDAFYSPANNMSPPSSYNGSVVSFGQGMESPRASSQYDSQTPPPGYSDREQHQNMLPMDIIDIGQQGSLAHFNAAKEEERQNAWCQITYYELSNRIGEHFVSSAPRVIVDGYTDPSTHNHRFSLGVLSNIHRNSTIESTRRAIQKGICLEENGTQVYVKNLCQGCIFFQSKNTNVENGLQQHSVVKIEPKMSHKIFDRRIFENLLQNALETNDDKTYERVYSLTDHCIIKMSFLKGWGSIYHRQDVTATPCWVEILLMKPYAILDQNLRLLGTPSFRITSTS